jgi:glycosyltransferase involved in cell wall biosynthesis
VKLTVTVITRNEARHIAEALDSVAWADERLVFDSGSTDNTVDVARAHGARVEFRDWPGYGAQKNAAADASCNDWILSLDADERVTPALADEIQGLL